MEAVADRKDVHVDTVLTLDYLNDKSVKLYFPTDHTGNVVHPTLAKTLECWEVRGEQRARVPSIFEKERVHSLAMALLRREDDFTYASVWHNVQRTTGAQLRNWALHLYRCPDGDVVAPKVTINRKER